MPTLLARLVPQQVTILAKISRVLGAFVISGMLILLRAEQLPTQPNFDSTSQTDTHDYVIGPDDELDIYVLDVPELSRLYRVSPTGLIDLPLLMKPVLAAGLNPSRLAQAIKEGLQTSGMVAHPSVTVQVKTSRIHSVAITGAVKKPQIYPIFGKTTLLDALAQAEGLAADAGNIAVITRGDISIRALGSEQGSHAAVTRTTHIDLNRLMEDGDTSLNLSLYPGDRVTVRRAGIVYVVGAVNRAGGFVLKDDREQITVLKAIALAESLKSTAKPKRAVILRKNLQAPGTSEEIPVDLTKILSGHTPDRPLLPSDILFVPDSPGKKALHRAGEAAAQAAALFVYRVP